MVFKMVTDSEKAAGRIAGNATSHASRISEDLTARWRERLPSGQKFIDIHQLQLAIGEELRVRRVELLEKEGVHKDRLEDVREARARRDAAKPALRDALYRNRDLYKTVYGDQGPWILFGEKPVVPADPVPLRRVAVRVLGNLAKPDLELPPRRVQGATLDPPTLARQIEEPLAVLDAALEDLASANAAASASLEAKQRAHARLDELNRLAAPFLEATYRLAGHDVIAARVRPSSHRSKESDPESEAPAESGTAAAEDAGEATGAVPEATSEESGPGHGGSGSAPGRKATDSAPTKGPSLPPATPTAATPDRSTSLPRAAIPDTRATSEPPRPGGLSVVRKLLPAPGPAH